MTSIFVKRWSSKFDMNNRLVLGRKLKTYWLVVGAMRSLVRSFSRDSRIRLMLLSRS